jgi:ribose 5-phosphate isomerase A
MHLDACADFPRSRSSGSSRRSDERRALRLERHSLRDRKVGYSSGGAWDAPGVSEDPKEIAREAAAAAVLELVEADMAIGLGSGRALWKVIDAIAERWPDGAPIRAVTGSERTHDLARAARIEVVELDGSLELDLAIDGADEIDPELRLIKGGGGALLREKIVVSAARRFVVVAEDAKRVERLGQGFRLPVEVARFGWADTRRRLTRLLPDVELREGDDGPYLTDEGHFILDCALPADADPDALDLELKRTPGVLEHGLFIGLAERALLGRADGGVDVLESR